MITANPSSPKSHCKHPNKEITRESCSFFTFLMLAAFMLPLLYLAQIVLFLSQQWLIRQITIPSFILLTVWLIRTQLMKLMIFPQACWHTKLELKQL